MQERLAYDPSFDRRDFNYLNPYDVKERDRLASYIDKQIDTHLGERFNVLQSTVTYELRNGQIFGENTKEPFTNVIKKGVVTEREQAELEGFEKIQKFFAEEASDGDMILSVSPPGGIYLHNFYDIFTLRENENGRFIEMNRFSSALTTREYQEKLGPFTAFDSEPTDVDFLSQPLRVNQSLFPNPEDLHGYLHKNHEFLTNEQFEKIKRSVSGLKKSYIDSLSQDEELQLLTLNAIYNQADNTWKGHKEGNGLVHEEINSSFRMLTKEEIYALGRQPVRVIQTPCGASGGFPIGNKESMSSPFRVYDKVKNSSQTKEWFTCPKCNYKADGPVGDTCPGCGLTKEKFAKQGGKTC